MTVEQLRKAVRKQPFEPFKLFMAGGREIRVAHPEMIWIPPESLRTFIVYHEEAFDIIDLLLVESLQFESRSRRRRTG